MVFKLLRRKSKAKKIKTTKTKKILYRNKVELFEVPSGFEPLLQLLSLSCREA
jgi:hypothetical protein